ncbi:protein translocase subunit SecF [Acidaminobacter sp. JC074]|uniref:protein translocase subunit SecF n=1 Tax=Acidaminobacter sp. JC074 TaxID=2530199 RepID=UPI001F0D2FB4|nr:protein translocase subunit SecF [Acidaminobacter sp. JC074]MCH4888305.1 protein translocase subunit SecF [Acidaminobacter sp. JC074]
MDILKHYKIWFAISLCVILVGIGMFAINGLNEGIDFQGGTQIQYNLNETFDTKDIEEGLDGVNKDLNSAVIKTGIDETRDQEVIIRTTTSLSVDDRAEIETMIKSLYPNAEHRSTDQYSASVGNEIKTRALWAVIIAAAGMLVYITFRFEIVFGVAAILALLHDVAILLSVYAIFQVPVNSAFIAAVLTVVGYSINDTIVVFDRIRENVKFEKRPDYFEIANKSLKQTIVRSINTSVTTLLVIGSLYVLGVDSIKELAFPLMAGVLAGTYSSIFIASPLWALWKRSRADKQQHYKSVQ